MILKDYTNPLRILSHTDALTIPKKEYLFLKELAKIERNKIYESSYQQLDNQYIFRKTNELYIDDTFYKELSILKKEIIISNIILPDDTIIIDTLTNNFFTINHLKSIIRFRSLLKNYLINDKEITQELKINIKIYKRVLNILINIFNEKFNIKDSTIILNRITELLITSPHLFNELEESKKLNKTKTNNKKI